MKTNALRPSYDRDVPTYLNEEFDHRRLFDSPVVTPPPFSVFEYVERYSAYLYVGRFRRLQTYGNEL